MKDDIRNLYDALVKNGYQIDDLGGSEENFRANMRDEKIRGEFYDWVVGRDDFNIGSREAYERRMTGALNPTAEQGIIPELLGVPYPAPEIDKSQYTFTGEQLGIDDIVQEQRAKAALRTYNELPTEDHSYELNGNTFNRELLELNKRYNALDAADPENKAALDALKYQEALLLRDIASMQQKVKEENEKSFGEKVGEVINAIPDAAGELGAKAVGAITAPVYAVGEFVGDAVDNVTGWDGMHKTMRAGRKKAEEALFGGTEGALALRNDILYKNGKDGELSLLGTVLQSTEEMAGGATTPVYDLLEKVGDVTGLEGVESVGKEGRRQYKENILADSWKKEDSFFGQAAQLVPQVAAIWGGIATGNPALMKAGTGIQVASSMGQAAHEAAEAGASGAQIFGASALNGIIELLTERIPLGRWLKKIPVNIGSEVVSKASTEVLEGEAEALFKEAKKRLGNKLTAKSAKEFAIDMASEGGSEFAAEFLQTLVPIIYKDAEEYPTFHEALQNGIDGLLGGIMMSGMIQPVASYTQRKADHIRRKEQGFVDVAQIKNAKDQYEVVEIVGENESGEFIGKRDNELVEVHPSVIVARRQFDYDAFRKNEMMEYSDEGYSQEPTGGNALAVANEYTNARGEVVRALGLADDDDVDAFIGDRKPEEIAQGDEDTEMAITHYLQARARRDGFRERYQEERDRQFEESDKSIDGRSNGNSVYTTMLGDQQVYITGGDVVLNEDGTIDVNNSSETLFVKFPDGSKKPVTPDKFTDKVAMENADELKVAGRAAIEEKWKAEFDNAENAYIEQQKRAEGSLFDMTDENGTHRVEVIKEGKDFSNILLDGVPQKMSTEELNSWKQEAGIQSTENGVQSTDVVADNATDNNAPTVAPTQVPIPTEKRGKEEREAFHLVPVERTMEELYTRGLEQQEIDDFVNANIDEINSDIAKHNKAVPKMGASITAYQAAKEEWRKKNDDLKKRLDYYTALQQQVAEATRSQMKENYDNTQPRDVVEMTPDEFIAEHLPRITPESFKSETGLSNSEQAGLVGYIAGKDKGGMTVEEAAENILENYDSELRGLGFTGDMQDVRNAIIDILSSGNPRSYAKRGLEQRNQESIDQQRAEMETVAAQSGFSSVEEMAEYESVVVPRIIETYKGFDENEYYNNLAENYGNDTTRESESTGRGSELLQGEQAADNNGAPTAGVGNQGGAVFNNVQGGGQDGTPQGNQQVSEPVGETDNLSSSEIPNNQSVAEGGNTPGDDALSPAFATQERKGGTITLHTKTETKKGYKTTRVVAMRNGSEVSMSTAVFPVPEGMTLTDIPEGVKVEGVKELREGNDGRTTATIMVKYGDGTYGTMETRVVKPAGETTLSQTSDQVGEKYVDPNELSEVRIPRPADQRDGDKIMFPYITAKGKDGKIRNYYPDMDIEVGEHLINGSEMYLPLEMMYEEYDKKFFKKHNIDPSVLPTPGKYRLLGYNNIGFYIDFNGGEYFIPGFGAPEYIKQMIEQGNYRGLMADAPKVESGQEGNAPGNGGVYADNQGNPVDADGKLIVDEVNSIDEITDEDFETPTRNVQLPVIPENVANAIGTNGRPVVIKRNVFEKNGNTHVELEPEDSRNILRSALYNPNLVGSTQPIRRPDYKVAIRTGDQNAVVVLDVYQEKDFVEIVGWRMVNEKGLAKMQRQAEREGGQFLILSPNDGSAAALSALPLGLSSASEDINSVSNSQENTQKSGEIAESTPEIQEPRSVEEMLDNGDKRITNYNSRGEVATVAIERDGKVVSVDSYDEGVLFEHTEYDGNGKATSVTRYDKQGNVVGTQVYEDGKAKTPMQKLADRILDRTEEKRRIPLRERARELEAQVGVKANIIESLDEVKNREARKRIAAGEPVAGWYSGGQVYLYMPNIKDRREIELTYVHEVVAHHGVKKLLGERFNEFLDGVWNMMSEADRARMLAYVGAKENPTLQDMRAAADEYVAELAEKMNLGELEQSTWEKIVDWLKELLENIGFENLTKEDIESMLKASYSNLRAESGKGKTGSTENDFRARMTFHGSGAQFDRFDHSFMGTGEGAQAFGWGTYVTEVEGIGKQYAKATSKPSFTYKGQKVDVEGFENPWRIIQDLYNEHRGKLRDMRKAADYYSDLAVFNDAKTKDLWQNVVNTLADIRAGDLKMTPSRVLYTVEIPDDNGSNYLHWEDVVPKKVETAVKERLLERLSEGHGEAYKSDLKQELDDVFRYSDFDGASLYKNISAYLGGDKQASLFLNDMSFVGISYPANTTTGGRADGARNYVIFNENDAEIKDRTMFRKKDSERRQEKRRINDIIDTAAGFVTVGGKKQATKNRLKKEAERKQLAKEMYSSVLKGDFNDVTLSQIDKFIEDATPANPFGRRISQRLPQRMERALRQGARTNAVDALFSRISESAVPANERFSEAGRREIEERKKELLKGWAIATGNWHTDLKEFTDDTEPIGEGKDSKVYMSKDGRYVIKASKGKPYGKRFRPDIDNIALFNDVFRDTRYEILGYGEIDGEFVRILQQPIVDFAQSTPLTSEERREYMQSLGFEPLNDANTAFADGEIVIADLQKGNVVRDAAGNISVIDADAKLHTKDVGGDYTYPPVEEDLPEDSGTRFRIANKNQDIFVSNAQRAVEGIQQNKATAEQWIAMLKKNGGLKAGEDAWLGLEEWLAEKQGAVTKQEILDFIAQNRIQIEEVQYDENAIDIDNVFDEYEEIYDLKGEEEAHKVMIERYGENFFEAFKEIGGELRVQNDKLALQILKNEINSTRLGYTTDGLENKREIALTVPTIEPYNASDEVHFGDAGNGRAVEWVRFGETTDSEGNRVLVIDEIQSKRHQEGREKGYRGVGLAKEVLAAEEEVRKTNRELTAYREPLKEKYNFKELGGSMSERLKNFDAMLSEEERITMDALGKARNEAEKRLQELREQESGIPSAPFEKNWHELAMKRILRLAAEEGFDKVAWTTGEQQAERYNMSKQVERIDVEDNGVEEFSDGTLVAKNVALRTANDNVVHLFVDADGVAHGREFDGKSLAEIVGKELAEKIMQPGDFTIEGDGLRIGGEGMKGFYDKMLPSFVQKYTKKWGAKVGEVTMPSLGENNTMWSVDVTPEMQESVMQGQTMFRMVAYDKAVQIADEFANTHKGATKRVVISKGKEALEQQMRDAGFTDFSIEVALKNYEGEENPTDGAYYVSSDGIVIYDAEDLNATLWHENAHRAIHRLLGDNLSELQRAFDNLPKVLKDRTVAFLEAKGYTPEVFPEEAVAFFIEGAYTDGVFNDGNYDITRFFKGVDDNVGVFYNFVQNVINNIEYEREETDNSGIYLGESTQQQLPERNGESYENGRGADATEGAAGSGTQEGETRFRTVEETTDGSIDDVPAQPLTLMERITNSLLEVSAKNKENLGLRADALRAFGRDINRVLSLMKAQKEYDKSTVDTLVKLAKMYFKNAQLLGEVTPYEMGRILSVINNVVGKRDVTASAAKLMDILLDAHTKALAGILDKAEKVKAKKVNVAGVEVMGRLDKYGQETIESYKAGKNREMKDLADSINESDNRIAELEERVREELGLPEGDVDQAARDYTGDNDVVNVYMDERARLEGLTLAREYKQSIQQVQEEIKDLKRELKQAEEDYRLGNIDGKSLKEFRKSVAEAIMESKAGLIEGYHSLIYKFQENAKESSKRAKAFAQAQIDRAREIQHNANSDMEGISAATQGTHPENYNNAVMNALRSPFPTLQGMLKKFGEKNVEGKGYLYERFIPQATKAGDNEFRGKVAARVVIEGKLKEIYGKEMTIAEFMKQLREYGATVTYREGNEMKQFDLTKGQMLYIYMVNKMPDGQMKLRRMGITDDVVAELMTKLPEGAVQFADWAQNELLKDLRGKYNAVHERVFGAPMAAIENYFPIKIRKEARGEKGDVSEVGQEGKPSTVTGPIIKRTKNATAIDLSADAMQVLMEHIDDLEHWAAFAEFNRDINTLINYKHFQNQVKNMTSVRYGSGTELWKNFRKTAQIASGTYRPSDSSIDRAVQNIAKGLTRSKINFRLFTAVKQLLSAPAFWTDAGVEELAYCYANPKGSFDWALENLPGFAERWQGRTMGNEKLLKSDSDWKLWRNEFVEKATRWGMTPNAAIDALTVAQGARAVYMTKLEQFKKAGYTEQRANEKALQAAAEAYNESQQSSEGVYLSPLQVEGTVASAIFSTFKNSNFGYTRKTAQAVANIKRKMRKGYKEETIAFMTKQMVRDGLSEENAKRFAEKVYNKSKYKDVANVAMFGFGLNLLWEAGGMAIYLLLGDDDEEKEKMMKEIALRGSLGLLNGIPFGETMISAAMAVKEGDTKYFRLPELIAVGDIENLAQVLNYDPVRGANDIVNMLTSMGVGVTPQVLTDILVAFGDVEEFSAEELGMFVARFVNAPQSNLDRLIVDDAMENSAINAEEIMLRYAEYKKSKNAPITQFLYSDEAEQEAVERYGKRFAKLLDERLENVVEDTGTFDLFYNDTDAEMKKVLASMRKKHLAGDEADKFQKVSTKTILTNLLEGKDIEDVGYYKLTNADDVDEGFVVEMQIKELKDISDELKKLKDAGDKDAAIGYKNKHSKELKLYKKLNQYQNDINELKSKMKKKPENAERHMAKIRQLRAKAIDLINNYRNNE